MWIIDFGRRHADRAGRALRGAVRVRQAARDADAGQQPARRLRRALVAACRAAGRRCARRLSGLDRLHRHADASRSIDCSSGCRRRRCPTSQLIVFARDDDYFFGVLHSRVHELWARGLGTQLERSRAAFATRRPRPSRRFPSRITRPSAAIAEVGEAARQLNDLRAGWLNPPGRTPGELAKRTLTNLYNQRPTWLAQAHERLDRAVHAAYGWPYPARRRGDSRSPCRDEPQQGGS